MRGAPEEVGGGSRTSDTLQVYSLRGYASSNFKASCEASTDRCSFGKGKVRKRKLEAGPAKSEGRENGMNELGWRGLGKQKRAEAGRRAEGGRSVQEQAGARHQYGSIHQCGKIKSPNRSWEKRKA